MAPRNAFSAKLPKKRGDAASKIENGISRISESQPEQGLLVARVMGVQQPEKLPSANVRVSRDFPCGIALNDLSVIWNSCAVDGITHNDPDVVVDLG